MTRTATRPTDLIIGRSLILSETVADDLRRRLAAELADLRPFLGPDALVNRAREILAESEPLLAELIGNSDLWGWIAGYNRVAQQLPPWAIDRFRQAGGYRPPPGPPRIVLPPLFGGEGPERVRFPQLERAAESLMDREILTRDQYDQLDVQSKQRAFTIAGDLTADTIGAIRDELYQDVREGTSLAGFKDRIRERLETSPIGAGHLENVYRTNVQAAFRDGREALAANPIVSAVFPYQEYIPITDGRVRPEHKALGTLGLNGTGVYRRDDPMWDFFTPPWGFQCRCAVNLLTIRAAADRGVREAQQWRDTGNPPEAPEWRIDAIPFRPPPGFGFRRAA